MHLFTSELFSSAMLPEIPSNPRSYREPLFALRYGRRRADRATQPQSVPLQLQPAIVVRIVNQHRDDTRPPFDYGRAA